MSKYHTSKYNFALYHMASLHTHPKAWILEGEDINHCRLSQPSLFLGGARAIQPVKAYASVLTQMLASVRHRER